MNGDHQSPKQSSESTGNKREGYTLPVFACAAAVAALQKLNGTLTTSHSVSVKLINPDKTIKIGIEQSACLTQGNTLAITRSDPGDNLDITRHTPIWAWVTERKLNTDSQRICILGGEGIGQHIDADKGAAIYTYAKKLLQTNLELWLLPNQAINVTIILPEGRSLATRTSNEAFGVINGLSLLGTSGISQPLSTPDYLMELRKTLRQRSQQSKTLVFCVGENGLNLAQSMGIPSNYLVKTANWLGPLLAEAGMLNIHSILLFGYHGKLIKLAGGIFHTHHHVADGRHETFGAACIRAGLPINHIQALLDCPTIEDALQYLRDEDKITGEKWTESIYCQLIGAIEKRSQTYIYTHSQSNVEVGTLMFDRQRTIIQISSTGQRILQHALSS